ncbi:MULTISPECIES: hypothetical protein [Rhodopseudomonas]|uniref:DUF4175 domain-containing protein n=1 Tax=Rhodopseudomonas palustris TaxID=1076 RepID=A0A0D7DZJ1_RHOPL|nr:MULTISPECIES: hypothetical protein [Rhodopseudomonas]KIZ33998.1 hypothetical protein OO17_27595 [Rhodopseudomonas palustris]MDF3814315.1 hypothetical protein [Rhodopseudomonas sp. BAL398]WOK18011.1 hypothetical protein RBJ75_00350 [Rhodopseudomonas sp. BAL398]
MIIAIFGSVTAIAVLCCLLFTLAIYALPALGGVAAGMWAYETGAGLPGSALVGLVGAGLVFGLAQFLILFARPMWVKLAVALAFVAPAAIAGFHATHGIVKHLMPSESWQIAFSVIGAVAVGITAFVRMTSMAPPGPAGQTPASI